MSEYNKASRTDGLLGGYLFSRPIFALVAGLPTLLLLVGIVMGYGWIGGDVRPHAVPIYERQYDAATSSGNDRARLVALNTLVQMRPDNNQYRFNLALLKLEDDNPAAGVAMMRHLSDRNFHPATIWVAGDLLSKDSAAVDDCTAVVESLRQVISDDPKNAKAHALLADVYLALRQPELATPHTRVASELDPLYWLKYSKLLSATGKKEEARQAATRAVAALRELVAKNPTDSQRRIQWSHALRTQGRLTESLAVLEQGLQLDSDDEAVKEEACRVIATEAIAERASGVVNYQRFSQLLQRALSYDASNMQVVGELAAVPNSAHTVNKLLVADIQEHVQKGLESSPGDVELTRLSAWCTFQAGDHKAAIGQLRTLVDGGGAEHRMQLASFLRDAGDTTEADRQAKAAAIHFKKLASSIDAKPQHALRLAEALAFLNRWDSAVSILDESATPNNPLIKSARVRYRLSQFDELSKRNESSRRQFQLLDEALAIDDKSRLAIAGMGILARTPSAVGKAAHTRMVKMLAQGGHSLQLHSQLGTNAIERSDYDSAVKHLERAIKLAPTDPFICNNLAFAICSSTTDRLQLKRSLTFAEHALKRLPSNPEILKTRGVILLKLEQFEDALQDFETVLADNRNDPEVHDHLAATYKALGNEELASVHRRLSQEQAAKRRKVVNN